LCHREGADISGDQEIRRNFKAKNGNLCALQLAGVSASGVSFYLPLGPCARPDCLQGALGFHKRMLEVDICEAGAHIRPPDGQFPISGAEAASRPRGPKAQ